MSETSSLELPTELKQKIERVAQERNEEPAALLASALDSLLGIEEAQLAEVRRRDRVEAGKAYTNKEAFARLDSLRPSRRTPSPE
ncbi:MAG TPA: hypothetical protein VG860_16425 [Terriglobia bacterium]|nr:hypothetical protein [Terriglobia bacterium]